MQCASGADVGDAGSKQEKSLIYRIYFKWSFPSGTTF